MWLLKDITFIEGGGKGRKLQFQHMAAVAYTDR